MWFLAEGRLQSVHLTVPRTLYIDYDAGTAGADDGLQAAAALMGGRAVSKVLPGGLKPQTILQV